MLQHASFLTFKHPYTYPKQTQKCDYFFKKKEKENQETNKVYETYQNYTAREGEAKKALICTTKLNFLGLSYIIFLKKNYVILGCLLSKNANKHRFF